MKQVEQLLLGPAEAWLDALPEYQRTAMGDLLDSLEIEEAVAAWMTIGSPTDTAPFGGVKSAARLLFSNMLIEIQKLLCGDPSYKNERDRLQQGAGVSRIAVITAISSAIGPHLGASAVFILPVVAVAMSLLAKAGQKTVCEGLDLIISDRSNKESL